MYNIWIELQEVRKIISLLKKHPGSAIEESSSTGFCVLVDAKGRTLYECQNFQREHSLLYADACFMEGKSPSVIELLDFEPEDP